MSDQWAPVNKGCRQLPADLSQAGNADSQRRQNSAEAAEIVEKVLPYYDGRCYPFSREDEAAGILERQANSAGR